METQFPGITNISYTTYDPQHQEDDTLYNVPIVQNSLGFTKELFTTKYLLGYYRMIKDLRTVLYTNQCFTPKGTNSRGIGRLIRESTARFIPDNYGNNFFMQSVIGKEDEE